MISFFGINLPNPLKGKEKPSPSRTSSPPPPVSRQAKPQTEQQRRQEISQGLLRLPERKLGYVPTDGITTTSKDYRIVSTPDGERQAVAYFNESVNFERLANGHTVLTREKLSSPTSNQPDRMAQTIAPRQFYRLVVDQTGNVVDATLDISRDANTPGNVGSFAQQRQNERRTISSGQRSEIALGILRDYQNELSRFEKPEESG